jgi:hypothetical protein
MSAKDRFPGIGDRTKILIADVAVAYAVFVYTSGEWLPTGGLESVWFLSAVALWFLTLLSSPWFLPPRDALANAVGAGAILVTIDLTGVSQFQYELALIRWIATAYCAAIAILSLVALFLHDRDQRSGFGRFVFRLTDIFGKGEILYTPSALISVVGAYLQSRQQSRGC